MSAHRQHPSMWHLSSKLPALGLGLCLVLALGGCPSSSSPEAPTEAPSPKTGAEIRQVVNALYEQKGEDAYMDPSLDPLLEQLEELARRGDKDAATLRGLILAKRRLALRAQSAERRSQRDPNLVRLGKVVYDGDKPQGAKDVERAEAVAVGTSRDELKAAYGGCLTRQTWYPARGPGTVTLELFQVTRDCRETLAPRVFRVVGGKVTRITPGDVDRLMEPEEEYAVDR